MHLLTQSAVLRSLGWSLFNSLWQMALLWLLYSFFIHIFKKASAHARHGMALLMLGAGAAWSAISFADALFFPGHADPATWLSNLIVAEGHPGAGLLSGASRLLVEALPYGS